MANLNNPYADIFDPSMFVAPVQPRRNATQKVLNYLANSKPLSPIPVPKTFVAEKPKPKVTQVKALKLTPTPRASGGYNSTLNLDSFATLADPTTPKPEGATVLPEGANGVAVKKPKATPYTQDQLDKLIKEKALNMIKNNPSTNELLLANAFNKEKDYNKELKYTEPKQRKQPLGYWNWGGASPFINQLIPSFQFMYGKPKKGFDMPVGVRFRPDWLRKGVQRDAADQAYARTERENARTEAQNQTRRKYVTPRQWANQLALAPLRALNSGYYRNSNRSSDYSQMKLMQGIDSQIKNAEASLAKGAETGMSKERRQSIQDGLSRLYEIRSQMLADMYNLAPAQAKNNQNAEEQSQGRSFSDLISSIGKQLT